MQTNAHTSHSNTLVEVVTPYLLNEKLYTHIIYYNINLYDIHTSCWQTLSYTSVLLVVFVHEGKQQQLPSRINVTWSVILLWYAQTRVVLTAAASSASARECILFSLPSWRWGGWFHWNCSSCKSSVVYQSQTLWSSCTLASETSPSLKTNKQDKTVVLSLAGQKLSWKQNCANISICRCLQQK